MEVSKNFSELLGLTICRIEGAVKDSTEIYIITKCNRHFILCHYKECCEYVSIEDVIGDISDLLDSPLTMAEEISNADDPEDADPDTRGHDSYTWTFYKLATAKGYVTIRWFGSSNGYYSERACFYEILPGDCYQ